MAFSLSCCHTCLVLGFFCIHFARWRAVQRRHIAPVLWPDLPLRSFPMAPVFTSCTFTPSQTQSSSPRTQKPSFRQFHLCFLLLIPSLFFTLDLPQFTWISLHSLAPFRSCSRHFLCPYSFLCVLLLPSLVPHFLPSPHLGAYYLVTLPFVLRGVLATFPLLW